MVAVISKQVVYQGQYERNAKKGKIPWNQMRTENLQRNSSVDKCDP